jgi:hypothetical protein
MSEPPADPVSNPDQPKPDEGGTSKDVKLEFIGAVEEGGKLYGAFKGTDSSFLITRNLSGEDYSITYSTNISADTAIKDLMSKPGFSGPSEELYEERFRKLGKEILGNFFKLVKRIPHWQMEKVVAEEEAESSQDEPETESESERDDSDDSDVEEESKAS